MAYSRLSSYIYICGKLSCGYSRVAPKGSKRIRRSLKSDTACSRLCHATPHAWSTMALRKRRVRRFVIPRVYSVSTIGR